MRAQHWFYAAVIGVLLGLALAFAAIWMTSPPVSHAEEEPTWTTADVHGAIVQAADDIGVSEAWLDRTVSCETGGTYDPYSIGKQKELGPAQLHPYGELRTFYAWGYYDPFSPWQAVRFMAQRFSEGGSRAWSCA